METTLNIDLDLLNQFCKCSLLETRREKTQEQINNLKIDIIREFEILPSIPTGSVEVFPDQEVTSIQCELAKKIFEYTKSKLKLQELQINLGKLIETYECISLKNSKLRNEIANKNYISDVLYDLLMELITAGHKFKECIDAKEDAEYSSNNKINALKEQLCERQQRMDEVQLELDKIVCNPKIDYKSYKHDLIIYESEQKYLAKLIDEYEYKIEKAKESYGYDMFDYDDEIKKAESNYKVLIGQVRVLCHFDSKMLNEFFELIDLE